MIRFFSLGMAVFGVVATAVAANAQTWLELGDAGSLPGTAQETIGSGPLLTISGSLSGVADEDVYCILITDPAAFSATTIGGVGFDSQLFLFDAAGFGVYANDDTPTTLESLLPAGHPDGPMAPGRYYLAISSYDNDPVSPGGLIFPSTPFTGVFGPTGPGGGSAISGWSDTGGGDGAYRIRLTGAEYCAVPEPGTLTLLGLGALPLARRLRRRARKEDAAA